MSGLYVKIGTPLREASLETCIIGLPKSGKTSIFNALTRARATTADFSASTTPNVGMAKVPDARLRALEQMFHPARTVPAEIKFVDIAAFPRGFGKGEGISGQLLTYLGRADALLFVVRVFTDPTVPHIESSVDPRRDIETLSMELAFSDLVIQERRLERIVSSLKGAISPERENLLREQALLDRIKEALERGIPVREQSLSADERKLISGYQFLTAKPLLVVANIGEDQLARTSELEAELRSMCQGAECDLVAVCGKLEAELASLSDAEAVEFRQSLAVGASALEKVIRSSYRLLGLISFFTVGADEVKAWTITQGTIALKAAGKIHSDIERGFIRAEVVAYEDLVRYGSMAEARRHGVLRLEGKAYTVQDGDVITILFNV
ncbi:MAG: redox-regulated ATPase YchF [Chloroflexi bacterium]|nr:redox-regulated ATPase YchF [Chloroflexota bacterium]